MALGPIKGPHTPTHDRDVVPGQTSVLETFFSPRSHTSVSVLSTSEPLFLKMEYLAFTDKAYSSVVPMTL
jgi:hypothetical protein